MTQTSFEGGWKAGILLSAERMNVNSANVLLKTLEEPPQRTLLLLITDSPQSLLPTIVSRCQKIVLSKEGSGSTDELWETPLLEIMRQLPPRGGLDAARLAGQLKSILDAVRDEIIQSVEEELGGSSEALDESKIKETLDARTNARLREVQSTIFQVMLDWQRDILLLVSKVDAVHLAFPDEEDVLVAQAARQTQASALQAIQTVEAMARRLDRNIPALQNFDEAFRKLVR
jgi:DNA polymerase-3 subunit delta'